MNFFPFSPSLSPHLLLVAFYVKLYFCAVEEKKTKMKTLIKLNKKTHFHFV